MERYILEYISSDITDGKYTLYNSDNATNLHDLSFVMIETSYSGMTRNVLTNSSPVSIGFNMLLSNTVIHLQSCS